MGVFQGPDVRLPLEVPAGGERRGRGQHWGQTLGSCHTPLRPQHEQGQPGAGETEMGQGGPGGVA